MVSAVIDRNARSLAAEFAWLGAVIETRLRERVGGRMADEGLALPDPPALAAGDSPYADFALHYDLGPAERVVVALALAPHACPQLLDPLFARNAELDRGYTEFGGVRGRQHSGFLPTGETAVFLVAGSDLAARFAAERILHGEHVFAAHGILSLRGQDADEPRLSGQLTLASEYVDYFTTGRAVAPAFGPQFPASALRTEETWEDLVLEPAALELVLEIRAWLEHGATVMREMGFARRTRPGYRSLFHGPPGTGKSMTAALLGKETGHEVYRIDLAMVVSKYVGETEKNLGKLFDQAAHHDWILFFDEADALFGRRTGVRDAHDRYANQEVAYLLQRVEEFDGVVILASNLREHIDEAFTRRFHSIIHFPMPGAEDRRRLWQGAFPPGVGLGERCDLDEIARRYEVSGGAIMNVARYAALMAASRGERTVDQADLERGIRRELQKEGRSV